MVYVLCRFEVVVCVLAAVTYFRVRIIDDVTGTCRRAEPIRLPQFRRRFFHHGIE